jgi:hypothetical protein
MLESTGELLDELKRVYGSVLTVSTQLEAEAKGGPTWLRPLLEAPFLPGELAGVIDGIDGLMADVGRERDQLCGGEKNSSNSHRAAKVYIAAMRSYHTKCAKRFDALLKSDESLSSTQHLSSSPSPSSFNAASTGSGSIPNIDVPAGIAGRPAPPLPARKTVADPDDPFAEQPLMPLEQSLVRARSRSNVAGLSTSHASPISSNSTGNVSPPASPRADPQPSSSPPPSVSPIAAATPVSKASLSPRGRGAGRKGLEMGTTRRGAAVVEPPTRNSENKADTAASLQAPVEFGCLSRPLKMLNRPGELELLTENSLKFEAQRKNGLLLALNFSLTVSNGADPSVSIYDVKVC